MKGYNLTMIPDWFIYQTLHKSLATEYVFKGNAKQSKEIESVIKRLLSNVFTLTWKKDRRLPETMLRYSPRWF